MQQLQFKITGECESVSPDALYQILEEACDRAFGEPVRDSIAISVQPKGEHSVEDHSGMLYLSTLADEIRTQPTWKLRALKLDRVAADLRHVLEENEVLRARLEKLEDQ